MDFGLVVAFMTIAFIGGILVDHFWFNKIAGLVSSDVAKLQAEVAGLAAKGSIGTVTHVVVPATPAGPAAPAVLVPATPVVGA